MDLRIVWRLPVTQRARIQWVVTVVLCVLAVVFGVRAYRRVSYDRAAATVCAATDAGAWNEAVAAAAGVPSDDAGDPSTRAGLECLCRAQYATKQGASCVATMERLLFLPAGRDWVPERALTLRLVEILRRSGDSQRAAELASRAAASDPTNADLLAAEIDARIAIEEEGAVFDDVIPRLARVPTGDQVRMRIVMAKRAINASAWPRAAAILGSEPPPFEAPGASEWYQTRMHCLAGQQDRRGMEALRERWAKLPGQSGRAGGYYALYGDLYHMFEAGTEAPAVLEAALSDGAGIGDSALIDMLYYRAIGGLAVNGRRAEARALYDRAVADGHPLRSDIDPDDLERTMRLAEPTASSSEGGFLRFVVPRGADGVIRLSPSESDQPDGEFVRVQPGEEVARSVGVTPQRWVYNGSDGTEASGVVWVTVGQTTDVSIAPGVPTRTPVVRSLTGRRAADGKRRVFVVILDCFDWRLLSYLRARGDLPTLDALIAGGWHAVLFQEPALTAAAMDALVHPIPRASLTMLSIVNDLGVEIGGLESVGRNPLAPLEALLPTRGDLFKTIGARDHSIANLIFAHGDIKSGRNAVVTGPDGTEREVGMGLTRRALRLDESSEFGSLDRLNVRDVGKALVQTIAAQFDQLNRYAMDSEMDAIIFRVEPTDILTHSFFRDTTHLGQDDGKAALFDVYRYVDRRLGEFTANLDADDTLIVMSDHGIRTSLRHDEHALFIMNGPDVPIGRAEGAPELRGVGRVIAELVGVQTDWPDTGVARWLTGTQVPAAAPLR